MQCSRFCDGAGIYLESISNSKLSNVVANANNIDGIYLFTSNDNELTDITANSNIFVGIVIRLALNNELTDITANSNTYYGIYLYSSSNNQFIDSLIDGSTSNDVILAMSSINNTFLNVSYDLSKESVAPGSQLIRKWYLDITVINKDKRPKYKGVLVKAYDIFDNLQFSALTDKKGKIPAQQVTEYVNNGGIRTSYNPYTLDIFKDKKEQKVIKSLQVNVTDNQERIIVL